MSVPTPPALGGSRRGLPVDGVTRRSLLQLAARGVVATGLALSVAGCGLRLDLPEPEPPVPTRKPAPDEALLVSVIGDLSQIVMAEKTLLSDPSRVRTAGTRSTLSTLLRLQREQLTVLTGRLTNDGVPLASITARPTAGPRVRSVGELAARLDSLGESDWAAVAGATPSTREVLTSAYSLRLAGAELLGRAVAMPTKASPAREAVIARTRPLVYAFEVVAAQSAGAQRSRAVATLDRVTSLEEEVAAGSGTVPTGWALPFPVTTPTAASRLATHVFSAAVASLVEVTGLSPTAASLRDSATWSARVQSLAIDWSVPLTPFPGTNE